MKKVLIVDDTIVEYADVIRNEFFAVGIYAEFVTSAEAAVVILRYCAYDAVLMDGTFLWSRSGSERILADVQGIDAIEMIRKFSEIPIIMISSEKENQEAGIKVGANDFADKTDWKSWAEKTLALSSS